jgi:hypothetical protein
VLSDNELLLNHPSALMIFFCTILVKSTGSVQLRLPPSSFSSLSSSRQHVMYKYECRASYPIMFAVRFARMFKCVPGLIKQFIFLYVVVAPRCGSHIHMSFTLLYNHTLVQPILLGETFIEVPTKLQHKMYDLCKKRSVAISPATDSFFRTRSFRN